MKYKDDFSELLQHSPLSYAEYIDWELWDNFEKKRLNPEWEALRKVQRERRAKNTNLHKLSQMGYVGLVEKMEKMIGREITDVDRPNLWTMARVDKHKNYMNEEDKGISDKIVS